MTLPTPPTLEQRLDAAAEYYRDVTYNPIRADGTWAELADDIKANYREIVRPFCFAFAPEHFKDTDTTTGKD